MPTVKASISAQADKVTVLAAAGCVFARMVGRAAETDPAICMFVELSLREAELLRAHLDDCITVARETGEVGRGLPNSRRAR